MNFLKAIKNIFWGLLITLIVSFVLFDPQSAYAANGGRIGGRSFQPQSLPRAENYMNSYRNTYSGFRRGGIGFPFIIPFFGFGGGGLFGFLILFAISGAIINSIRGVLSPTNQSQGSINQKQPKFSSIIQVQVGLLAQAKSLQKELIELAESSDTKTSNGLQFILQETTVALLRISDLWVYGNCEKGNVPYPAIESTFNKLSITERSKIKSELISNFSGKIQINQTPIETNQIPKNEFIAVTILIATNANIPVTKAIDFSSLKEILRVAGSISSNDLLAIEVIWQPQGEGEILSSEELVTAYPNLKYL